MQHIFILFTLHIIILEEKPADRYVAICFISTFHSFTFQTSSISRSLFFRDAKDEFMELWYMPDQIYFFFHVLWNIEII